VYVNAKDSTRCVKKEKSCWVLRFKASEESLIIRDYRDVGRDNTDRLDMILPDYNDIASELGGIWVMIDYMGNKECVSCWWR